MTTTTNDPHTHVVSAAIVRRIMGSFWILLAQRSEGTSFPLRWCTPGGKVEAWEMPLEALARELMEELHVEVFDGVRFPAVYTMNFWPPLVRHPTTTTCYLVDMAHIVCDPRPGDKTVGVGWFSAADLGSMQLAPADNAGREYLVRALGGTNAST